MGESRRAVEGRARARVRERERERETHRLLLGRRLRLGSLLELSLPALGLGHLLPARALALVHHRSSDSTRRHYLSRSESNNVTNARRPQHDATTTLVSPRARSTHTRRRCRCADARHAVDAAARFVARAVSSPPLENASRVFGPLESVDRTDTRAALRADLERGIASVNFFRPSRETCAIFPCGARRLHVKDGLRSTRSRALVLITAPRARRLLLGYVSFLSTPFRRTPNKTWPPVE